MATKREKPKTKTHKKSKKKTSRRRKKTKKTPVMKKQGRRKHIAECDALAMIDAAQGQGRTAKKTAVKVRKPRRSQAAIEAAKRPGRPPGPAPVRDVVVVQISKCKKCGSTRRSPYVKKQELPYNGKSPVDGSDCSKVVNRPTKCLDCGQHRVDKEFS
jgi:hypothetical protein